MSGVRTVDPDVDVDLGTLFSSVARDWRRNLAIAAVVTLLALMAVWLVPAKYRAETRILIETRESIYTRPEKASVDERPILDEEGVASQVELITSADLLKKVAAQLDLASKPEFDDAINTSAAGRLLVLFGLKSDPDVIPPEERVLKAMRERLDVHLVEKSRVIVIGFSSTEPKLAADVPEAIAEAYVALQREAKLQSNSDATEWLELEIEDLRKRVKEAEARVAAFRADSDLLIGQNNAPLATQQLAELSSELSRVRAASSSAQAKAEAVKRAIENGLSLDALPDVTSSPLIQRLRERRAELSAEVADLSTTLLGNHPRIKALRSQLAGLDSQIEAETRKLLQGLRTEAETARYRERQLLVDLDELKRESARAGEQQVELRALEREAAAQRQLLESYLTRYREAASRRDRNYLPADARIFEEAIVPLEPYFPKYLPIAVSAFFGSLLVLVIMTLMRELFSGRAMRYRQAMVPAEPVVMPAVQTTIATDPVESRKAVEAASTRPVSVSDSGAAMPDRFDGSAVEAVADRLISSGATRAIFISPEGDEAAASSVLVAREIADAGLRVLLLDLTSSGAASRPMLDGASLPGITNLLAAEAQFTEVIHSDHFSDCDVIPIGTADPGRAMRAVERLPIIMGSLTTAYDVVVVECGPTDAEGVRRLVEPGTGVMVSVIEPGDTAVADLVEDLRVAGYDDLMFVSPSFRMHPPMPPAGDRTAA